MTLDAIRGRCVLDVMGRTIERSNVVDPSGSNMDTFTFNVKARNGAVDRKFMDAAICTAIAHRPNSSVLGADEKMHFAFVHQSEGSNTSGVQGELCNRLQTGEGHDDDVSI